MKKVLVIIVTILIVQAGYGQEVRRTLGVGLQSSFPTFGLSAKYAITEKAMVQATLAPFGGGVYKMTFYGGRFIYRFPDSDQKSVSLDPYVYAGAGLMNYKTNLNMYGMGSTNDSYFSYGVGGGLEVIFAQKLGLSAEVGYGNMKIVSGVSAGGVIAGGGLHFYIF